MARQTRGTKNRRKHPGESTPSDADINARDLWARRVIPCPPRTGRETARSVVECGGPPPLSRAPPGHKPLVARPGEWRSPAASAPKPFHPPPRKPFFRAIQPYSSLGKPSEDCQDRGHCRSTVGQIVQVRGALTGTHHKMARKMPPSHRIAEPLVAAASGLAR